MGEFDLLPCETKLRHLTPEHAKDYYNKINPEHKHKVEKDKKATKNKTKSEAKKIKNAKIAAPNK